MESSYSINMPRKIIHNYHNWLRDTMILLYSSTFMKWTYYILQDFLWELKTVHIFEVCHDRHTNVMDHTAVLLRKSIQYFKRLSVRRSFSKLEAYYDWHTDIMIDVYSCIFINIIYVKKNSQKSFISEL